MNRREFVRKVTDVLRENNIRKPVYSTKHTFHISDDEGNSKDFIIKQKDRNVLFTIDDIDSIVDVCTAVISNALSEGDSVSIRGFGTLGLRYRQGRKMRDTSGKWIECQPGFVPKFSVGKELKRSAKLYEVSVQEKLEQSRIEHTTGDDYGA